MHWAIQAPDSRSEKEKGRGKDDGETSSADRTCIILQTIQETSRWVCCALHSMGVTQALEEEVHRSEEVQGSSVKLP